jgi:alanyl-tRNA synthetase
LLRKHSNPFPLFLESDLLSNQVSFENFISNLILILGMPSGLRSDWNLAGVKCEFSGYQHSSESNATVVAASQIEADSPSPLGMLHSEWWLAISPCPFYPEGGGQVGETGTLEITRNDGACLRFQVIDTVKPFEGAVALKAKW